MLNGLIMVEEKTEKHKLTPAQRLQRRQEANAKLPLEQAVEAAKERALRALDRSEQSRSELVKKLQQAGYIKDAIAQALDRLEEVGLVDDERYALMLIRSRFSERGLVGPALARELNKKGINPQKYPAVTALLSQLAEEESDSAQYWAKKKARQISSQLDKHKAVNRIAGFLTRKGYGPDQSWSWAKRAWEQKQEEEAND